jgi:uncharacterized protein YijF (DUF1287 family)
MCKTGQSRLRNSLALALFVCLSVACRSELTTSDERSQRTTSILSPVVKQVVEAAIEQTNHTFYYDPSYVQIDYPGGDVPLEKGVCTDVVIRAFRKVGVDLQKEVHEDMARNFAAYPKKWGLARPDANIDHRRVPNLMIYFQRKGKALAVSSNPKDYQPGDVVTWDLSNNLPHTGIVTNILSEKTGNYKVAHNIGSGVKVEDVLFA